MHQQTASGPDGTVMRGADGAAAPLLAHGDAAEPLVQSWPPPPRNGLAPSLARKRLQVFIAMMVLDALVLVGTFYLVATAYLVNYRGQFTIDAAMLSAWLVLPIFLTIGLFNSSYSGTALVDWRKAAWRVAAALVIAALLFNFVAFFAKMNAEFSRVAFALSVVLALGLLAGSRLALLRLVRRRWGASPVNRLLIAAGGPLVDLPGLYRVDAALSGLAPAMEDPAALNRLAMYLRNMDEVFVSCPEGERTAWSQVLKASGVHAEVVSPVAREIGALGIRHYPRGDFSTFLIATGALRMRDRALKRGFDILASLLGLIVLAPLMVLVALAILLEDGRPVFFRQRRVGRANHFFRIFKFRSMRHSAGDAAGVQSASRADPRITRVGRFIRRTSVDELPQLLNVLAGDMSIVGPRPHALGSQAGDKLFWQVDGRYWQRHGLRPGITGLAQVRGQRGATASEDDLTLRLQSDLEYLRDWSLLRDIAIILSTLRVLVHDRAF